MSEESVEEAVILSVFVLEDEINFPPRNAILKALERHHVTVARSAREARDLYKGPYDLVLLDHDMEGFWEDSEHPNTGYQFLKWVIDKKRFGKPKQIILHSQNPVGRRNMLTLLRAHGYEADEIPFGPKYVEALRRL